MPWVYTAIPEQAGDYNVAIKCKLPTGTELISSTTLRVEQLQVEVPRSVVTLPQQVSCNAGQTIELAVATPQDMNKVVTIKANWNFVSFRFDNNVGLVMRIEVPTDFVIGTSSATLPLILTSQQHSGQFTDKTVLVVQPNIYVPNFPKLNLVMQENIPITLTSQQLLAQAGASDIYQLEFISVSNSQYVTLMNDKITFNFPHAYIQTASLQITKRSSYTWTGVLRVGTTSVIVQGDIEVLVFDSPAPYTCFTKTYELELGNILQVPLDELFTSDDPIPGYYTTTHGQISEAFGRPILIYKPMSIDSGYSMLRTIYISYIDWYNRVWTSIIQVRVYRKPIRPYYSPIQLSIGRATSTKISLKNFVVNPDNVKILGHKIIEQGITPYTIDWLTMENKRLGNLPTQVRTGEVNLVGTGLKPPYWSTWQLILISDLLFGTEPTAQFQNEVVEKFIQQLQE